MGNLLDEALLDMEQIKKSIEEEAKNKLAEVVAPQIRQFINERIYGEAGEKEEDKDKKSDEKDVNGEILLDDASQNPVDPNLSESEVATKGTDGTETTETIEDQKADKKDSEAITYEKDPSTGEEKAVLDLDKLGEQKKNVAESKNGIIDISNLDENTEFEVDLKDLREMLSKFGGDNKNMNQTLSDIFLKENEKKLGEKKNHKDTYLSEGAVIEIDENELKEAIQKMKLRRSEKMANKKNLKESEVVLDIDVDPEGEIEDVEVVSVGKEEDEPVDDEAGEDLELDLDDLSGGEECGEELPVEEPVEDEKKPVGESVIRQKIRKLVREEYAKKVKENKLAKLREEARKRRTAKAKKLSEAEVSIEVDDVHVEIEGTGGGAPADVSVTGPADVLPEVGGEEDKELGIGESKKLIGKLKSKLVETNLMNAKLVYANKLLMSKEVGKDERVRIIESLDKAKSLREVELVYRTLTSKPEKKKGDERVTESRRVLPGGSSASVLSGEMKKDGEPLNESAAGEVARWQTLAGIKG